VIRELITRPIQAANALIELPWTINRSLRQANDLMEASRRQLEVMQRQTDEALVQAQRMNEMLSKVVRLTEPIEMAAKGGEYAAGALKRVIFGAEQAAVDAESAAGDAERAALEAEEAASHADNAAEEAEEAEEAAEEATSQPDVSISESGTVRVIPNRPAPGSSDEQR
jgi:methyl-accepting chemotaxis protein